MPVITPIVDFVFERDVLRDEDFITDARLKLFEIALETRAVVVGRAQGAQGARPEPVVDGELPLFHDEIRVECVVHTGTMLSKLGFEFGLGLGLKLRLHLLNYEPHNEGMAHSEKLIVIMRALELIVEL